MRDGRHPEGSLVLRARIDMRSPNMNMRDPVLYRIRFAHHHRTGDRWSVYPMYDYAHPLSDALERITHSLCTLEFEDHRPLYDWLIARVAEGGYFDKPLPRQIEFARLNLNYTITSKRRLQQLVSERHVDGWDDPRMTTLVGPAPARLHARVDPPVLRPHRRRQGGAVDRHERARAGGARRSRRARRARQRGGRSAAAGDHQLRRGRRPSPARRRCIRIIRSAARAVSTLTRELWIEREDFAEDPPKGFFRLAPDRMVRLRYGYVVKCTGFDRGPDGRVATVYCEHLPGTRSGTPGADSVKVKGNIHWVSAREAVAVELRIYDRLFTDPQPDLGGRDFLAVLNHRLQAHQHRLCRAVDRLGRARRTACSSSARVTSWRIATTIAPDRPVFNRVTTLKDSFGKRG